MHQAGKGNQWYFGKKAHMRVDSRCKLIDSMVATADKTRDSQVQCV
jgi:IS5 family transposase